MDMKTHLIAAALIACTMASPVFAMDHYTAKLSGDQESKPTGSAATGEGVAIIANDGHTVNVVLKWAGLSGKATAGHIHCCAEPGTDAGVAIMLKPAAATSGDLKIAVDLDKDSAYTPAFLAGNGGNTAGAKAALVKAMADHNAYFNIHTAKNPSGEIRGNIDNAAKAMSH